MIIDAEIYKKAKELYAATGGSIESVAGDLSLGNPAAGVARALGSPEGLNLTNALVARALGFPEGCNFSYGRIARALQDGLDLYAEDVASALYSEDGLNLSLAEVAKAMMSGLGWSMPEVARVLFPFVKWDPVPLLASLQGCGMKMTDLISAMLNAPEKFNAGDIAGVLQRGFGLSIPEVAKRLFEEEPDLDVESRALTLRMGLGAGISQAIDILRDNGVAAADAKNALGYVFSALPPEKIDDWIDEAYGLPMWVDRTTALFSYRLEFHNNLDCDGSPFSESRFSPSTLGDDSIASCFIKAVKVNAASESGLDDMTGVRVELKNSYESLYFKTDLASVEKVMEMIQNGVIKKTDRNNSFRWDEENQIFSIGGSGRAAVADLDFPIVRVEGNACVEIASVKGRAEIRNNAIVSIGKVGGSIHVTDRASCVAKVVAGDANLWGSGTLTVGSAGNLVNKGMNPILVQPEPVVVEPPVSYRSASEIRAAKNTSKKGIK